MERRTYEYRPTVLLEVRAIVRRYENIDSVVMECLKRIPEDDFCHFARESFQLGIGYGFIEHLKRDTEEADATATSATPREIALARVFFESRPVNRYTDPHKLQAYREHLLTLAFHTLTGTLDMPIDDTIDPYELEALVAFLDGYLLIAYADIPVV